MPIFGVRATARDEVFFFLYCLRLPPSHVDPNSKKVVWNNLPKKVASSEQQLSQWRIHCDVKSTIHVFLLQKEVEFKSNIGLSLYKFLKST
jgi:hypothetical protein